MEENDSSNNARSLESGNYVDLQICPNDDDWYEIEVTSESDLSIAKLSFIHSNGDLDFALYNEDVVQLDLSDGTENVETPDLSNLSPGTYLLRVYGYNGASNTYDLSIN